MIVKRIQLFSLVISCILILASCGKKTQESQVTETEAQLIQVAKLQELIAKEKDLQLIDVRTPKEFEKGHIPNAININYKGSDFENKISKLSKDKPVAVYCARGGRSARSAKIFEEKGFKTIYDLEGGFTEWSMIVK